MEVLSRLSVSSLIHAFCFHDPCLIQCFIRRLSIAIVDAAPPEPPSKHIQNFGKHYIDSPYANIQVAPTNG